MTQINFRQLFGILFTLFILILVFIFAVIAIAEKLSIIAASILIIIPLAIRYAVYTALEGNYRSDSSPSSNTEITSMTVEPPVTNNNFVAHTSGGSSPSIHGALIKYYAP